MHGSFPSTRHRRLRQTPYIRALVAEHQLSLHDFIYPVFIREPHLDANPLGYEPFYRYTLDELPAALDRMIAAGIIAIMLFPVIDAHHKDDAATIATHDNTILCQALQYIRNQKLPLTVYVDVALDPYTAHGHDGILINGVIDNDTTVAALCELACRLADAGADVLAPSDMMDGRIGAIRTALDTRGYHDRLIMSYTAKYASHFYGPFRTAVSAQKLAGLSDKKTYQMDYRNRKEALNEAMCDIHEGADMLIVKPGLPYLDVVHELSLHINIPIFAYHVSGEYMMVKAASEKGYMDAIPAYMESCMAFKRAGARGIISYAALELAPYVSRPMCV